AVDIMTARIMRVGNRIQLIPVGMIIHFQSARLRLSFPDKFRAIVFPRGENADFPFRTVLFDIPEKGGIMVVYSRDAVVPYVMLMGPGTRYEMRITNGRNGG